MMERLYEYKSLDISHDDAFRILELQPGVGDAPIACSLRLSRLGANPDYEAISYVWGSSEKPHHIRCEATAIPITSNLRDALLQVRLPDRPRAVWADSICINQEDPDEKSSQVSAMGRIYREATRVLIYLGPEDGGHGADAVSLLQAVSGMITQTLQDIGEHKRFPYPDDNDPFIHDERWPAVNEMVKCQWFQRGWVVQEAALAKDAVMLWGDFQAAWTDLLQVSIWISNRAHKLFSKLEDSGMLHWMLHILRHSRTYRSFFSATFDIQRTLHPLAILCLARSLSLGDPRDRVFAFHEMISRQYSTRLLTAPDYRKTREEVYVGFATGYIESTQELNILRYIHHTEGSINSQTPSWVPLWDSGYLNADLPTTTALPPGLTLPKPYFVLGRATKTLEVQAMIFDTISNVSEPLALSSNLSLEDVWKLSETMTSQVGSGPYSSDRDLRMFLRTLCQGGFHVNGAIPAWIQAEDDYIVLLQDFAAQQPAGNLAAATATPGSPKPLASDQPEVASMVHDKINDTCRGRKFVVTERGYYGLGPLITHNTDIIMILPGAGVPFVLRETEAPGEYKVVGEIYMTGTHEIQSISRYWTQIAFGRSEDWLDMGLTEENVIIV